MISLVSRTETRSLWSRFQNYLNTIFLLEHLTTLGARGFSCANSGFGQVLKSDSREKLRRSCLRPSAEHVSACGRRNEAPRRTREKTSGTQGSILPARHPLFSFLICTDSGRFPVVHSPQYSGRAVTRPQRSRWTSSSSSRSCW